MKKKQAPRFRQLEVERVCEFSHPKYGNNVSVIADGEPEQFLDDPDETVLRGPFYAIYGRRLDDDLAEHIEDCADVEGTVRKLLILTVDHKCPADFRKGTEMVYAHYRRQR